nr:hypothetical protein [uncultured Undibacterium sp.]
MKWQKLGKIFDPSDYILPEGCAEYAKSPQVIVFDNYVRIYFSAQKRTENGKFLSRPMFVDMNKSFDKVLRVSETSVLPLGSLGSFDEHGVFPFHVLSHGGNVIAYTTGWSRRISVSIDMSIGLAISRDGGLSFSKLGRGGPIMSASLNEPFLVGDAFVRYFEGQFHMWYIFGDRWCVNQKAGDNVAADRFYRIAHAVSPNGIDWERNSRYLIDTVSDDECQALPTVFFMDGRYHMYFCFRNAYDFRLNKDNAYRLAYAYSDDLITWVRADQQAGISLSDSGWDSEMMCYPHVVMCDDEIFMLYNGNEFGRYGFGIAKLAAST